MSDALNVIREPMANAALPCFVLPARPQLSGEQELKGAVFSLVARKKRPNGAPPKTKRVPLSRGSRLGGEN